MVFFNEASEAVYNTPMGMAPWALLWCPMYGPSYSQPHMSMWRRLQERGREDELLAVMFTAINGGGGAGGVDGSGGARGSGCCCTCQPEVT